MNPHPSFFPSPLAKQFIRQQSTWGRCLTQLQLEERRLAWLWLVNGNQVAKRGLDLFLSFSALVLLSPLFLFIGIMIKLEDGGPVIFSQTRVGRFGREFPMYKFRSMHPDAEQRLQEVLARNQHLTGVTFKIKDDPRITRFGKWLRKYSFDELPQLFNVFIGDMSLVGPRPPLPREVLLYSLADRRRLAVHPGITCIWQISGRAEIDFPGQVNLDVSYIETLSVWQDVKILCKTVPAVLAGTGAY
jgi:lipopolysaccharide/colanic/teichoic acid biosynthesis glycosyltransferase